MSLYHTPRNLRGPFQKLQGLPRNGKPIAAWSDPDEAWTEVARGVRELCDQLCKDQGQV
jgi:hypothetical protein